MSEERDQYWKPDNFHEMERAASEAAKAARAAGADYATIKRSAFEAARALEGHSATTAAPPKIGRDPLQERMEREPGQ